MIMYYRFGKYLGFFFQKLIKVFKILKSTFLTKMCPVFLSMAEQYQKPE